MEPTSVLLFVLTALCRLTSQAHSARILFYFGVSGYSHRIAVWPLVEALAAQGHSITFLSPIPPKPNHSNIPNVTEVSPQPLQDYFLNVFGKGGDLVELRLQGNHRTTWDFVLESGVAVCEILMKDTEYLKLIGGPRFDLVVIDALYNDCVFGLIHFQKTKFVWFDTSHPFPWQYDSLGFPAEPSWIPDLAFAFKVPMSWLDRVSNTLLVVQRYFARAATFKRIEAAVNEALLADAGLKEQVEPLDISKMEKSASLVLYNSHFSVENARSLPPLFVSVAGLHVQKDKKEGLPENIRKAVEDASTEGFVYISFGTAVQMHKMKLELRNIFFDTIRKFPKIKFVWKWESDTTPENLPSNIVTGKWMPQNDILAHPKIRAFVTHGGLLSIQEAITYKVPLILFPFFAEQDFNAERADRVGYGIGLDFRTLTQPAFEEALTAILQDSSYKEKMTEVSEAFQDRPSPPLETALWWIDYVLRRKDTAFMMPLGVHQSWFVRRSLDVWGPIVGTLGAFLGFAIGYCCRRRSRGKISKEKAH